METRLLPADEEGIRLGGKLIAEGRLVGFPTETVYGLGGDALNGEAVRDIFRAKGRPADNPLIVHVADEAGLEGLCLPNETARALMRLFWPGPLTLLMKKTAAVPDVTTAGLDTVAVRCPAHPAARALIRASGVPIAAPSGNLSGRPSPTTAGHMLEDMDGRIPLILDGGPCSVGVESTVLSVTEEIPVIFRPGGVTREEIAAAVGDCRVADSVMRPLKEGEAAPSPGMRHRHYAPKGRMTVVEGDDEQAVLRKLAALYDAGGGKACILCHRDHLRSFGGRRVMDLGDSAEESARVLFALLREMDEERIDRILCEGWREEGVGLAVMNRMARAAAFDIVRAEGTDDLA